MVVRDSKGPLNVDLSCNWLKSGKSNNGLVNKSLTKGSGLSNPLLSKTVNDVSGVSSKSLSSSLLSDQQSSLLLGSKRRRVLLNSKLVSSRKSDRLSTVSSPGSLQNKGLTNVTCFAVEQKVKTGLSQSVRYINGGALANPSLMPCSVSGGYQRPLLLSKRKRPCGSASPDGLKLNRFLTSNPLLQSTNAQSSAQAKQAKHAFPPLMKQVSNDEDSVDSEEKVSTLVICI